MDGPAPDTARDQAPVQAKVALVEAASGRVLWLNEAAANDVAEAGPDAGIGRPLEEALPLAAVLGVTDALPEVAATGEPRHLSADLVSTAQGRVKIVASVYLVPGRAILVVIENAWQPERSRPRDGDSRSRHRRR